MSKDISRSLLQRSASVCSGIIMTFAVPIYLTPNQQGYFYTFASVLAIQIFFELCLSQVLLYKFSSFNKPDENTQSSATADQLRVLLHVSRRIYVVIAILFFFVASIGGYVFLSRAGNYEVQWHHQWFALVLATAINLVHSIKIIYLESQGRIADVATFRLKTGIISTIFFVAVLSFGGGLWAAAVIPSATAICTSIWLYSSRKTLIYREGRIPNRRVTSNELQQVWRCEIFPLQWRMSISWISGYFIFQLITPVVFERFGPGMAGRLGFAISAMNSILFVSTAFTSTIAPRLASFFHAAKIIEFNSTFDTSFKRSLASAFCLTQVFVLVVYLMPILSTDLAERFLPWYQLQVYSLSVILSAAVYCWSVYLRSQSIEPLLLQSAITALVMAPAMWFSSLISINSMLLSMVLVSALSSIAAFKIYYKNRLQLCVALLG